MATFEISQGNLELFEAQRDRALQRVAAIFDGETGVDPNTFDLITQTYDDLKPKGYCSADRQLAEEADARMHADLALAAEEEAKLKAKIEQERAQRVISFVTMLSILNRPLGY